MTALLVSGLIPAVIAAAACWLAGRVAAVSRGDTLEDDAAIRGAAVENIPPHPTLSPADLGARGGGEGAIESAARLSSGGEPVGRQRIAPAVLALGWAIAVSAGLLGQRLVAGDESPWWWPEDFWQRGYGWMLLAAVVLGSTAWSSQAATGGRWVVAGLLAMGVAFTGLPADESWADTFPLHREWMLLLGGSCLVATWSLDRLARRRSQRWFPLVVLASLAGPMLVAATTYGALVQWTLAAISATLVCVGFALAGNLAAGIGIAYPAAVFCTVMMAAGRFYSYEDHPWWSYLGMLLIAPAISLADAVVARRSTAVRIIVAASVAVVVIAASALWHLGDLQ